MNSIAGLTPKALRRAADIQERILELQNELSALLGDQASGPATPQAGPGRKARRLSAAGRAAISAAVRARWDRVRMANGKSSAVAASSAKPKRKMSASAKAKLSALAKERWKKAKSAGKARL